ncbi:hypothetical protein BKA60DRAFT_547137 [Fusarium oxysporum]|nr:hypothetical protein BKA60DRAFT_547137 [Fusarium oxysporum]
MVKPQGHSAHHPMKSSSSSAPRGSLSKSAQVGIIIAAVIVGLLLITFCYYAIQERCRARNEQDIFSWNRVACKALSAAVHLWIFLPKRRIVARSGPNGKESEESAENSLAQMDQVASDTLNLKNSQFSYLSPREILTLYTIYRYPNTIQLTHFQAYITFGQGESGLERSTQQMLATPRRSRGVKGALCGYRTHCLLQAAAPKGSHWPHS